MIITFSIKEEEQVLETVDGCNQDDSTYEVAAIKQEEINDPLE